MEPNLHVILTPRYAAVVTTDFKGGEKRLRASITHVYIIRDSVALRSRVRLNPTKLPERISGLATKTRRLKSIFAFLTHRSGLEIRSVSVRGGHGLRVALCTRTSRFSSTRLLSSSLFLFLPQSDSIVLTLRRHGAKHLEVIEA